MGEGAGGGENELNDVHCHSELGSESKASSAIIITIRHGVSRGQMMNPPLSPFRKVGRRRPKPDYGAGRMGGFESCFLGR
jgi:hypothetical protein